jgi:hypothetical protein
MEAICSSETSVHTRTTQPHIPENGILHSHRRENLKYYIFAARFVVEMGNVEESLDCYLFGRYDCTM